MNNNNIEFRFVTRTKFRDYQVFINGGTDTLSNREDFRPLRQKAYVIEGKPCAALFEEDGKIYVLASSLFLDRVDERGRGIRFSFCKIFQSLNDRQRAQSAFIRLIDHWNEAEAWLDENLHEDSNGEGVSLDEKAFVNWLLEDSTKDNSAKFTRAGGKSIPVRSFKGSYTWPKEDYIFRYDKDDDSVIEHCKIGREEDIINPEPVHEPRKISKPVMIAGGVTAAAVIAGLVIEGCYVMGDKKKVEEINETKELRNRVTEELSVEINSAIPGRNLHSGDLQAIILDSIDKDSDDKRDSRISK